jgi:DNA-binding response OmpR family regulator
VVSETSARSPLTALVVDPTDDAVGTVSALSYAGFTVTLTDNFEMAKRLLARLSPLVLVTEVRLGAYNGIHLALRCSMAPTRTTVIVTSRFPDAIQQRDAEGVGATFVQKPFTAPDLRAAIFRTALRRPKADGTFEPVQAPFERRHGERRTAVVGGLPDRRQSERRRDIAGLLIRAASLT